MKLPEMGTHPIPWIATRLGMAAAISAICLAPASASVFTIQLRPLTTPVSGIIDPLDGPTDARWALFPNGTVEVNGDFNSLSVDFGPKLTVRINSDYRARSAMEFNLGVLPDYERVKSATLNLYTISYNVQTLFNVGYVRHLDATRAVGDPGTTWSYADLGAGTIVGNLGPSLASQTITQIYDVAAAVAADHRANAAYSPFSLAEEPGRGAFATVNFGSEESTQGAPPRLVVETEIPDPISAALTSLGGNRYRYNYTLTNDVSRALELIDIEFDPLLYAEDTLALVSDAGLSADWDQFILASGIDVPMALTLAALQGGVGTGQSASGFAVEFDWLGADLPGSQPFTVYDAVTFDPLYTTNTSVVPLPAAGWLLLTGLGAVASRLRRRRVVRAG